MINRRHFIRYAGTGTGLVLGATLGLSRGRAAGGRPSMTPAASFDATMKEYMEALGIPGGAVAALKDGRLIHAKGYGWANGDRKIAVTADSLFRIASLSKPITALAILKLAEENRLDLAAKVFELLKLERFASKTDSFDVRWRDVTIRHLLQHTGGWDRDQSFDPMFRARQIAQHFHQPSPAGSWDVIRYMLKQPLEFNPGERYAYSNFGYCLLGRVIEHATGRSYEEHMREAILRPAGCEGMRQGHSLSDQQAEGEVRYYMPKNATTHSVFGEESETRIPWPYGGFYLEAMDAHGGWIASVRDLAKITLALGAPGDSQLLRDSSFSTLRDPPPAPAWRDEQGHLMDAYYGCGWMVRPQEKHGEGTANFWHSGSLPGTTALWVRRHDGISYIALFNQRNRDGREKKHNLDPMLHRAADRAVWQA